MSDCVSQRWQHCQSSHAAVINVNMSHATKCVNAIAWTEVCHTRTTLLSLKCADRKKYSYYTITVLEITEPNNQLMLTTSTDV